MQGGGKLHAIHVQLAREFKPLLDRPIGIVVANRAWRQLLQRRRQDADFHEFGFEFTSRHGSPFACKIFENCVRSKYESTIVARGTTDYATKPGLATASKDGKPTIVSPRTCAYRTKQVRRRMRVVPWPRRFGQRHGHRPDTL